MSLGHRACEGFTEAEGFRQARYPLFFCDFCGTAGLCPHCGQLWGGHTVLGCASCRALAGLWVHRTEVHCTAHGAQHRPLAVPVGTAGNDPLALGTLLHF